MAKSVLTLGTFDVPHLGHANFLRKCAEYGDLTIGVNSDRFVMEYKKRAPIYNEMERITLLRVLGHRIVLNDGPGYECIKAERPNIVAVSTDWLDRDYMHQIGVTREWLEENDIAILFIPHTRGVSTTEIRARLVAST